MEQDTVWFDKKPSLTHTISRQRTTVAVTLAVVLAAYAVSVCLALFWNKGVFAGAQVLFFLAAGLFHLNRLQKDLHSLSGPQKWGYTLLLAALVCLLFAVASLWGLRLPWLMISTLR